MLSSQVVNITIIKPDPALTITQINQVSSGEYYCDNNTG